MKRVSLVFMPFLLLAPLDVYAQSGPVLSALTVSSAYCEVVLPCGSVGVYVERESSLLVEDGQSDNGQSSFLLRFAPLPQKGKQGYKPLDFAQSASAHFQGLKTKNLATQTSHNIGLIDISWDNSVPEFGTSLYQGSPIEQCNSYFAEDPPAWIWLKLDGEVVAKNLPCDISIRYDVSCTYFPAQYVPFDQ